jgi:type I site-specific restriction endonuclease
LSDITSLPFGEFPGKRIIKEPIEEGEGRKKYYVRNVPVFVVAERVQYYYGDGKLITDLLKDYTKKAVEKQYASLDSFLNSWTNAEKKTAIIKELIWTADSRRTAHGALIYDQISFCHLYHRFTRYQT